jgi:hypothetical protein
MTDATLVHALDLNLDAPKNLDVASQLPKQERSNKQKAAASRMLTGLVTANNWAELKLHCEAGGFEISLSESFVGDAASYPGQIDFSGKVCVVQGNGKILDAGGAGHLFYGNGEGSSLVVHSLTLKNGLTGIYVDSGAVLEIYDSSFIGNTADDVSRFCSCCLAVL